MKKPPIILLLSLILLPIVWNSIGLFHYMVEHTHTFCLDDSDHTHTSVDDCLTLCQFNQHQQPHQLPSQIDYQELKQYLTPNFCLDIFFNVDVNPSNFVEPSFLENPFSKDIFHPPITCLI